MIRGAVPDDLPALLEMSQRFFDASGYTGIATFDADSVTETLVKLATSEEGRLLVADKEGKAIGFCGALAFPHYFNRNILSAQELFWWVDEPYRKTGAGKALLRGVEEWAASVGASSLMMVSLHSSPPSVAQMYLHAGYGPAEQSYIKRL